MYATLRIHPSAIVGKRVRIGAGTYIGAYSVIGLSYDGGDDVGGEVVIGVGAVIGHHSIIYNDVTIEDGVILDPFSRAGPNATIGSKSRLLYGARVHEEVRIGSSCSIGGNCPDRTTLGDHVIHLGRIAHSYYHPFAEWDEPTELGPNIGSFVLVGVEALIIGSVRIGNNVFIFPREIVRKNLPGDGVFRNGRWQHMPNWAVYLRSLGKIGWLP